MRVYFCKVNLRDEEEEKEEEEAYVGKQTGRILV